jgi:hypothetical protein
MGPLGQGPMTGRGMGWCSGAGAFNDPGIGPGFWMGRGRGFRGRGGGGFGWRGWFNPAGFPGWPRFGFGGAGVQAPPGESEGATLRRQAEALRRQLENIEERLRDISASRAEESR